MTDRNILGRRAFIALGPALFSTVCFSKHAPAWPRTSKQPPHMRETRIRMVDDYFLRAEGFGFLGSVVVGQGGRVVFARGYGERDWMHGPMATAHTAYDIASLDKQFIAATILLLEQDGHLEIGQPLTRFFDFIPEDKRAITLHSLLSHTSGIDDIYWDSWPDLSLREFVRKVSETPLASRPGSTFLYSSANYWVLQSVIEVVSGKSFDEFLRLSFTEPLGMGATGVPTPAWKPRELARLRALDSGRWSFREWDYGDILARPAALRTMVSSASDLGKWWLSLRNHSLLSDASVKKMTSPNLDGYGYGWNISRTGRGTKLVEHGGAGTGGGMRSTFRWFPDEDVFFAILSGTIDPTFAEDYFAKDIEALIFGGSAFVPPPSDDRRNSTQAKMYAGKYALGDRGVFELVARPGNRLVLIAESSTVVPWLLAPDLAASPDLPQAEDVARLVRSLLSRRVEALVPFLANEGALPAFKKDNEELHEQIKDDGAVRAIRVLQQRVFDYDGDNEIQSLVGIEFEKRFRFMRILQTPGQNPTIEMQESPPRLSEMLAPIGGQEFLTWNFTWGLSTAVQFGRAGELWFKGKYASLRAERIDPSLPKISREVDNFDRIKKEQFE